MSERNRRKQLRDSSVNRATLCGLVAQRETHIAELEAQVANFQSDAYVLSLLTKIDELEAWQKCVRLWASEVAQVADEEQMAALHEAVK